MAELSGVEVLQSEIEKSKDKLRTYNENIKKLTGRDPNRPGVKRMLSGEGVEREDDGYGGRAARGRGRLFGLARRGIMEDNGPPSKRRVMGGAFSRLGPAPTRRREREDSPYEEELPNKLSVQSSVVSTSRETKSRKEIMQEQTNDKDGMQRNRRMFGLLLGTLNKFKTESKTLETKEVQRKKIEEKLEEIAEKEKKKFKQETKLLIEEMHLEQSKISRLEQKMEMVQEHADRAKEMEKLKNFISTKTKPRIFWKPAVSSSLIENKLKESKKVVDEMLQEGQDRLEKEIKELMEREYKREERIKMRLREDGLFGDEEEKVGGDSGGTKEPNEIVVGVGVVRDIKQEHEDQVDKTNAEEIHSPPHREEPKSKSRRIVVLEESEKEDHSEADSEGEDFNVGGKGKENKEMADGPEFVIDKKGKQSVGEDHSSSDEGERVGRHVKVERQESEGKETRREVVLENRDKAKDKQGAKESDEEVEVVKERGKKQEVKREKSREGHQENESGRRVEERQRRGSASRERRGSASRERRGTASRETRGSASREGRGSASREGRGSASRERRGSASREGRGSASRERRGSASREKRGSASREGRDKKLQSKQSTSDKTDKKAAQGGDKKHTRRASSERRKDSSDSSSDSDSSDSDSNKDSRKDSRLKKAKGRNGSKSGDRKAPVASRKRSDSEDESDDSDDSKH